MSSTEVDDAMRRAEADRGRAGYSENAQAIADRYFLANEVTRLRDLYGSLTERVQDLTRRSVDAPVAMYGAAGREPICDFDCDYCRKGDDDE
jgi:hypothetical protein